jgi:Catalase
MPQTVWIVMWSSTYIKQQDQLKQFLQDTMGQVETTDNGAQANTGSSLRAGPRGFVLLEDTAVRKKMIHFDRERQPERVVHAAGHGACPPVIGAISLLPAGYKIMLQVTYSSDFLL